MKNKDSLYILLLTTCMGVLYVFLFSNLRWNEWDTPNFVAAAKILFGDVNQLDFQSRITKPFVLFFPGLLNYLFGLSITAVMFIQNCIFWLGTGLLFSKLIKEFGCNLQLQLVGVFMLFTVQPIAVHAFELINDIAGYFFTILILYYYFRAKFHNKLHGIIYYIISFFIIIGLLSKESVGLSVLIIIIDSILDYTTVRFKKNMLCISISLLIVYIIELFLSHTFNQPTNVSYLYSKIQQNNGVVIQIKQLIHSFDVYWIFIVLGIFSLYPLYKKNYLIKLLVFSSIALVPFLFIWPLVQDRTIAIIAPVYVLVMIFYIHQNNNKWILKYMLLGGVLNILVTYIIYNHTVPNILELYYSIYFVVFIIGMFVFYKKPIVE